MNTLKNIVNQYWKSGNPMFQMILINTGAFLALMLIRIFGSFTSFSIDGDLLYFLGFHAGWNDLWVNLFSIFTFQFTHIDFWHFFGNMLFLYFFGQIFIHLLGSKNFIVTYIVGGIFGAIFYFFLYPLQGIHYYLTGSVGILIGASASIYAIAMAAVYSNPNFEVMLFGGFRVKLMWLGAFFVIYNLAMIPGGHNVGGILSHIGGIVLGYISVKNIKDKYNPINIATRVSNYLKSLLSPRPKMKVSYKKEENRDDYSYMDHKKEKQDQIDAILDKISKNGYDSLSKSEKEFLFKQSNDK